VSWESLGYVYRKKLAEGFSIATPSGIPSALEVRLEGQAGAMSRVLRREEVIALYSALRDILDGPPDPSKMPFYQVRGLNKDGYWWLMCDEGDWTSQYKDALKFSSRDEAEAALEKSSRRAERNFQTAEIYASACSIEVRE
jgi:hypothetical protein